MKLRLLAAFLTVATLASATTAAADPIVLRFATEAPDGTAWARLFRAMGRDIETNSNGALTTKWYVGGIAGDEPQMLARLKLAQLDVVMSGGVLCMKLAPSLRVMRLFGLFQSRDEASYVIGRLRPTVDREFAAAGFQNVGEAVLGSDMLFSRTPINSAADLKKTRLWFWDLDDTLRAQLAAAGAHGIGLPVEDAARAYEDKRVDGFVSVPAAALAFQWSAAASYLSELTWGYLPGCMVMSRRTWETLSAEERAVISDATGKFQSRLEAAGRAQDAELLGSLFQRQGLKKTPVSPAFAAELQELGRAAREAVRDKLIPGELLDRVAGWVSEARVDSQHAPH